MATTFPSTTPRIVALDALLAGGQATHDGVAAWAAEVIAAGDGPQGIDPAQVPADWRLPLADAGIPFAAGGRPWEARIVEDRALPAVTGDGTLLLPPLATFRQLTSLPLKPLRAWVQDRFGVRLQVATGVRLWLWVNQLVVVNGADSHRGGFIHGPVHGMRTVAALDPGEAQVVRW